MSNDLALLGQIPEVLGKAGHASPILDATGRPYRALAMEMAKDSDGPINQLLRLGVTIDERGNVTVPKEAVQALRADRVRRATVTTVPNTPRMMWREVGGMAVQKGHSRWESITMEGLRRIRERSPLLNAIHSARQFQIRMMCRKWSGKKGTVGLRVVHKDHLELDAIPPEGFDRYINQFENVLARPAPSYDVHNTGDLFVPLWEDLATINRPAIEKLRSAVDPKRIVGFRPVDGGILWPTLKWTEQWLRDNPAWHGTRMVSGYSDAELVELLSEAIGHDLRYADYVLVRDGSVERTYSRRDLVITPWQNRTDITFAGYPPGHVEQAVESVMAFLTSWEYNASYFCVSNCLISTSTGLYRLEDLVGKSFEVWNGRAWRKATAYETGHKPMVRTKLWNGLELKTSQEHKFRVLPKDSTSHEPEWRIQRELAQGDVVLVDCTASDPPMDETLLGVGELFESRGSGKPWTPTSALVNDVKFWEMVGFMLGDGYWPDPAKRTGKWLAIFPHHTKDAELSADFLETCARHGINANAVEVNKHITRADGVKGYPAIRITHVTFIEWLMGLGFAPSCYSRRMPDVLYQLPAWVRGAVLRGLFSADGHRAKHVTGYCTPTVFSADASFRHDILTCLLSVGVASNECGMGWEREGKIIAQDVPGFVARVGYLQAYKNEDLVRADQSVHRHDKLHPAASQWAARRFLESEAYAATTKDGELARKAARGECAMSRPRALAMLAAAGIEAPEAFHYHHVEVDVRDAEPIDTLPMYDVEVFDDEHVFLANHMAVHNTRGMMTEFFLAVMGDVWTESVDSFLDQFREGSQGVRNAHVPMVLELPSEGAVQRIDLKKGNVEMGFETWMSLVVAFACADYRMDPSTINAKPWQGGSGSSLNAPNREQEISLAKQEGLQGDLGHLCGQVDLLAADCHPDLRVIAEYGDFDPKKEVDIYEVQLRTYRTRNEVRVEDGLEPIGFWVASREAYMDLSPEDQDRHDKNPWNMPTDGTFAQTLNQQAMQEQMKAQQAAGAQQPPGATDGYGQPTEDGYGNPDELSDMESQQPGGPGGAQGAAGAKGTGGKTPAAAPPPPPYGAPPAEMMKGTPGKITVYVSDLPR